VAGLALLLGAGGTALYYRTKGNLEREADSALLSTAWGIASALHADEGEILFDPAPALAAEFQRADHWAGYEVWRSDGSLFARSASLANTGVWCLDGSVLTRSASLAGASSKRSDEVGREPTFEWIAIEDGRPAREISMRIALLQEEDEAARARSADGNPERALLDELTIHVAEERADTRAMLAGLRTSILAVITMAFLMSLFLVHLVLRRGLSPLEAMAAQAQRIDADSLDQRFSNEPLPAELEPIRTRLNDLLDRLQQSFERERRFNAAVAHELRTPIAELRTLSEIALRWPENADATKNMTDVSHVAQEMQSIVDALLTLRRVESGAESIELEPVRVDEVVRATLATYAKAATARSQTLEVEVPPNTTIESHPHMLRAIVSNLISNAIEYAPVGSTIEIACRVENERFAFSTTNPAPDLTQEDVLHLFEPFWRKDAVRTTGSNAGLGLTLTQSLAHAVGCALRARLESSRKLTLEVEGAVSPVIADGPSSHSTVRNERTKARVEAS
jgi:two-component system sensor histidine kinase QseC